MLNEELLKKGAIALVQISEMNTGYSAVHFNVVQPDQLGFIHPSDRVMFLSWNRALSITIHHKEKKGDDSTSITQVFGDMTIEQVVPHLDRSYQVMQNAWPYESWFVGRYVYDYESAMMLISPGPVLGAFQQVPSMLPPQAVGVAIRIDCPVCYFPSPEPPEPSPNSLAGFLGGGRPSKPKPITTDLKFPT